MASKKTYRTLTFSVEGEVSVEFNGTDEQYEKFLAFVDDNTWLNSKLWTPKGVQDIDEAVTMTLENDEEYDENEG